MPWKIHTHEDDTCLAVHVYPIGDAQKEHIMDTTCWCEPILMYVDVQEADGKKAYQFSHKELH